MLVLRGEPGIGKTALLEYVAERASGWRIVRVAGVDSEMELAFAGLHQLCAPMLDGLDRLPGPQRDALRVAFGLQDGAPNRFLVALGVLSLLADAAESEPLVCLVDDVQWLDRASAQALAFVARRLLAERIAMIFAVRDPNDVNELTGLPELVVGGLADDDARWLLASAMPGRLDEHVRDQIVAETHGNPLALRELPHGLTPAEVAGGFGLPDARPLASRVEEAFVHRVQTLPPRDPAAAPGGSSRTSRRREPVVARSRAARYQREREQAGRRCGADRVWDSGALPASARPVGGLPRGFRA